MAKSIFINGKDLTIEQVYQVANAKRGEIEVKIEPQALEKMKTSREIVLKIVKKGAPVYGINTGFGALSNKHIAEKDLSQLQVNLIRSHCTGVGRPFAENIVRAIMLLRANCLTLGMSGVTPGHVELLLDFLNHHITPVVPEKGSVGASGDLAPLSHIALALIGEGEVFYDNKCVSSDFAIDQIGKKPAVLGPKDGLALINGTAVMTGIGALALYDAERLAKTADIISMMTLEAVRGSVKAYHPGIHELKPHAGQIAVANNLRQMLTGSEINDSHRDCDKVQDPYSLRCIPQVHGACRQTIRHALEVMNTELNSVTDNPLVISETEVISGGNFHGEAMSMCMDYLSFGMSELANISERRMEKMMNPTFSDLPAFMVKDSGLNSGFMIAHVTMAALASENKYLCHPACVDSIPTSTDKEDHVSMGVTAGRKLLEVIENLKHCLSIELLTACQGIDLLAPLKTSKALQAVHSLVRKHVPMMTEDKVLYKDMNQVHDLVNRFEVLEVVEKELGTLE